MPLASYRDQAKLTLLVSNFEKGCPEQELQLHFGKHCGEWPHVEIRRDLKTGQSLGYAIVAFRRRDAFEKALNFNKTQFRGRTLKVSSSSSDGPNLDDNCSNCCGKSFDSLAQFEMQLNRRFAPHFIAPDLKRCPGCFLPLITDDLIAGATVYNCPKCHRQTKLYKDYDEHYIMSQCLICFELCRVDEMIPCRAEHLFCRSCIDRWLVHCTRYGTAGKMYLPCPNCEALFLRQEIGLKVSLAHLKMFEESLLNNNDKYKRALEANKVATNDDSALFRRCPKCHYSWIWDPSEKRGRAKLAATRCPRPGCWHAFCKDCLSPWPDLTAPSCKMCQIEAAARQQLVFDEQKEQILKRQCPNCSQTVHKLGASNHVFCQRCHTGLCYICREPNIDAIEHYCRCFRDPEKPDEHQCSKRCTILQDSELYDAQQLQLLEREQRRQTSEIGTKGSSNEYEIELVY